MRPWFTLLMVPALGCSPSFGTPDDARIDAADAVIDAAIDARPDAQQCFGSFVSVCLSVLPSAPFALGAADADLDIDTGSSALCDSRTTDYCVLAGTGISIAAGRTLRAHGSKPLILIAATAAAQIAGAINVSSSHDGTLGAGAVSANLCAAASPPTPAAGAAGGFGGSFGGKGGDGEKIDNDQGKAAPASSFPAALRGGCPGGTGGAGGAGGNGGGAVIVFASSIQLDGSINASGAGGHGGLDVKSGGGGGGSGGMIVLDAATISGTGAAFANGGGGGQGGAAAAPGEEGGESTAATTAAAGGVNNAKPGGKGGAGSAGLVVDGDAGAHSVARACPEIWQLPGVAHRRCKH